MGQLVAATLVGASSRTACKAGLTRSPCPFISLGCPPATIKKLFIFLMSSAWIIQWLQILSLLLVQSRFQHPMVCMSLQTEVGISTTQIISEIKAVLEGRGLNPNLSVNQHQWSGDRHPNSGISGSCLPKHPTLINKWQNTLAKNSIFQYGCFSVQPNIPNLKRHLGTAANSPRRLTLKTA